MHEVFDFQLSQLYKEQLVPCWPIELNLISLAVFVVGWQNE